jgi:hypothetical protein
VEEKSFPEIIKQVKCKNYRTLNYTIFVISPPLGPKILFSTPFSNTSNPQNILPLIKIMLELTKIF